jgi:putative ABC transport system permease protein
MNFKLAFLNLFRHRTRSLLSLLIIAAAIVSIVVFRGYAGYMLRIVFKHGVENQIGHLQIGNEKLWAPTGQKMRDQLFEWTPAVDEKIKSHPEVEYASPRLSLQALVTNVDTQFGAKLIGFDPVSEVAFRENLRVIDGQVITDPNSLEIVLGSGLQKRLKVKTGQEVSVVTQTVDGVVNAMDLTVRGIFQTNVAEVDNQIAFIPIKTAKTLLDTSKVEVLTLRLRDPRKVFELRDVLQTEMKNVNPDLTVKTWRDLANLYNQVEGFYNIQNLVIQIILCALTVLAILNTVGMTVYERTGEIGTLRSLGLRRREIIVQFMAEGFFLSLLAAGVGSAAGCVVVWLINSAQYKTQIPGASDKVLIQADLMPSAFLIAIGLGMAATLVGTVVPAWRASKLPIVDALRRNI